MGTKLYIKVLIPALLICGAGGVLVDSDHLIDGQRGFLHSEASLVVYVLLFLFGCYKSLGGRLFKSRFLRGWK